MRVPSPHSGRPAAAVLHTAAACLAAAAIGCASPGPPRQPSLQLPAPVHDLTAERVGSTVILRFTLPTRTTDKLLIADPTSKAPAVTLKLCRELPGQPCQPVTLSQPTVALTARRQTLTDILPASLATGPLRLLTYQIELLNSKKRSAGPSEPADILAGQAPAPVEDLTATGSRLGTLLTWRALPGDHSLVTLRREDADHKVILLNTNTAASTSETNLGRTLDTTATNDATYRYTAYRQQDVTLTPQPGTQPATPRTLHLRSADSPTLAFTLHDTFPPPVPTGLTVAAYTETGTTLAADLIWQPVDDPGLAGYNIYRETPALGGTRTRLNPTVVPTPAFHDPTVAPNTHYRYSVTAIDTQGNESATATAELLPQAP